jgi:hypothetical protein
LITNIFYGLTEEIINMLAKAELSETRIVFFREGSDFIEEY